MKKMFAIMLCWAAALSVNAEEFLRINATETCCHETFDGFVGTYDTLPGGFSVYKDAAVMMTNSDPDFRGISDGGVNVGGCYSWFLSPSNRAIGFQPTDTKFTPGIISVMVTNTSASGFRMLNVSYDFVFLNRADRASSVHLEYSITNGPYRSVARMAAQTPLARTVNAVWVYTNMTAEIELDETIASGLFFSLRWILDDVAGSGTRDEIGIDNLKITANPPEGTVFYIY